MEKRNALHPRPRRPRPIRFEKVLVELRKKAGLSQDQLADRTGLSATRVSRLENRQTTAKLREACTLADLFGVTLDEMVFGQEPGETSLEQLVVRLERTLPGEVLVAVEAMLGGLLASFPSPSALEPAGSMRIEL